MIKDLATKQTKSSSKKKAQSVHQIENNQVKTTSHSENLINELNWLEIIIAQRVSLNHSRKLMVGSEIESATLIDGPYKDLVDKLELGIAERLTLAVCIALNLRPELLDSFLVGNPDTGHMFRQYGGVINKFSHRFQPTLRTVIFLLSGNDSSEFIFYQNILRENNVLFREQIINVYSVEEHQDYLPDCLIQLDPAFIDYLFAGEVPRLDAGVNFPAKLLETSKTFEDLVLKESTINKLYPALNYVKVQQELYKNEEVNKKLSSGFVLLLHGPPGTGKTLTASIIGNELNTQVYQIDSSMVISKYIGETEKNLERVFNRLQGKNCILFFDEADAIFGKRTEIMDSKDKYANQGVSYLLQRLEKFDGLVILATNYENNFDSAFKRRILTKVFIGPPTEDERILLWNKGLPEGYTYESQDLINAVAGQMGFTGANISVIIKMAVEHSFAINTKVISAETLKQYVEIVGQEVMGNSYRPLTLIR